MRTPDQGKLTGSTSPNEGEVKEHHKTEHGSVISVEDLPQRRKLYRSFNPDANRDEERIQKWRGLVSSVFEEQEFGFWESAERLHYENYLDQLSLEELVGEAEFVFFRAVNDGQANESGTFLHHLRTRFLDPKILKITQETRDNSKVLILHTSTDTIEIPLPDNLVFHSGQIEYPANQGLPFEGSLTFADTLDKHTEYKTEILDKTAEKEKEALDEILSYLDIEILLQQAKKTGDPNNISPWDMLFWLGRNSAGGISDVVEKNQVDPFSGERNTIEGMLSHMRQSSLTQRQRISAEIGAELAGAARRYLNVNSLFSLLLRRNSVIAEAFHSLSDQEAKENWGYDSFPNREKENLEFRLLANYWHWFENADLEKKVQFAEWLEQSDVRLDMTRSNDPTIFRNGYFSGPMNHEEELSYEDAIYFGVQGNFYEWGESADARAIIQGMPAMFVRYLGDRGEATMKAQKIYIDRSEKEISHGTIFNGDTAKYEFYDPRMHVFQRIPEYSLKVSKHALDIFNRFYPSASFERVSITMKDNVKVEYPFIVISKEEAANPLKLSYIQGATGCSNVIVRVSK